MKHAISHVSVDVLALAVIDGRVMFACPSRETEPFFGVPSLPGVLLLENERLVEAATRALEAKAALRASVIGQLQVFDEPARDPRGSTLSVAMWATVDDDDVHDGVEWRPIGEPGNLGFDHSDIVERCRPILSDMLWRDLDLTRGLTGEPVFLTTRAHAITADLATTEVHYSNLKRKLSTVPGLATVGADSSSRGRPTLWGWEPRNA